MPRNAKKLKIALKVIIKAIISYLILSINLFRFSVRFRDGREGTGREITTLVPSRFPTGPGLPTGWSRSLGKPRYPKTSNLDFLESFFYTPNLTFIAGRLY